MKIQLFFIPVAVFTAIILSAPSNLRADEQFDKWVSFSKSAEAEKLITWLRCGICRELIGEECRSVFPSNHPSFYGRFGVFITLVKGKRVRGCYGAMDHKSDNLEIVLTEYLRGALRSDDRTTPVDVSEIDVIKIIVTIADRHHPVSEINLLDITRYGIIITDGRGDTRVFVPAEIRSLDGLRKMIKKFGDVQIYAFRAVTIRGQKPSVRSAGNPRR